MPSTDDRAAHASRPLPVARSARRPRRSLILGALLVALYLAWQLLPGNLTVFSHVYDEGVYAQTAVAIQQGHALYAEIFSAQAPLLPYLLAGLFELTGPSIIAGRLLVILLSLAGLAGVALLAGQAGRWPAALGALTLLALSPDYLRGAHILALEVPALALAILALAVASRAARGGRWAGPGWLGAGLLLALATLTKLSALVVVPALLLLWLLASRRRPIAAAGDLAALALPPLLLWGLVLSQVDPSKALDQIVTSRVHAHEVYRLSLSANLSMMRTIFIDHPAPWLLSVLALPVLWRQDRRLLAVMVTLLASTIGALAFYTPLFEHHLVQAAPGAAVVGGIGLAGALAALRRLARPGRLARSRLAPLAQAVVLGLAILLVPRSLFTIQRELPDAAASWQRSIHAVVALEALPPDKEVTILTDDPMIAFEAGLEVPPLLIDTSRVRISTGYLAPEMLEATIEADPPEYVLFWSNRLRRVPGFLQYVRAHYHLMEKWETGQELYVRRGYTTLSSLAV